jgi:CHASE2 domain-containing sensor protein
MTADAPTAATRRRKFPTLSLLLVVACAAAAAALTFAPVRERLDSLEYWTADWRTVLLADRVADTHPGIVIVLFDPQTFNGEPKAPIPRDVHAQIIRTLDAMGPAAIGLDFYYILPQGPSPSPSARPPTPCTSPGCLAPTTTRSPFLPFRPRSSCPVPTRPACRSLAGA